MSYANNDLKIGTKAEVIFQTIFGTIVISGGLAGEHGIPRINNLMEISVLKLSNGYN